MGHPCHLIGTLPASDDPAWVHTVIDGPCAKKMMTPLDDMIWFEKDEPLRQCIEKVRDTGHTCFPVARSSLDQVLGVVSVKDLLSATCEGQPSLESIIKPAVCAANHLNALQILDRFRSSRAHMILVHTVSF